MSVRITIETHHCPACEYIYQHRSFYRSALPVRGTFKILKGDVPFKPLCFHDAISDTLHKFRVCPKCGVLIAEDFCKKVEVVTR